MSDTPVILHIGLHRCGSTSIQKALAKARTPLEAAGWRVMLRDELMTDRAWAHLRRLHRPAAPLLDKVRLARLVRAIDREERGVIVSYENLIGTMPGTLATSFYPDLDRFSASLAMLQAKARRRIEVRLVTRPVDAWWESVHMFRAIRGYQGSLADFLAPYPKPLPDPEKIAAKLTAAGVQHVAAIGLGALMEGGGEGLARFLGLPVSPAITEALTPERANARMSAEALARWQALHAAGEVPADPAARDALLYRFRTGKA